MRLWIVWLLVIITLAFGQVEVDFSSMTPTQINYMRNMIVPQYDWGKYYLGFRLIGSGFESGWFGMTAGWNYGEWKLEKYRKIKTGLWTQMSFTWLGHASFWESLWKGGEWEWSKTYWEFLLLFSWY